jgi:hypothetical protein
MPFGTIAGTVEHPLARGVQARFMHRPSTICPVDFMVSDALNSRCYGLLALRDVLRHFQMETEGEPVFDDSGKPVRLPNLMLRPFGGGLRVRYQCPGCQVETWSRPGVNLFCGDCNRRVVNPALQ